MSTWWIVLALVACGSGDEPRERKANAGPESEKKAEKEGSAGELADKPGIREKEANHRKKLKLKLPKNTASRDAGQDILFITWDTIRADHMSLYGYPRRTTPRLDRIAEKAVVFERFIVPMATTLPSHTSMFTGVRPEEHGIIANATELGERFVPSQILVPIAKHLGGHGYITAGIVSSSPLKKHSGIQVGFDNWSQPVNHHRRGADTTDAALKLLKGAPKDVPMFMWVHYYDPHSPYVSPPGRTAPKKAKGWESYVKERRYGQNADRRLDAYDTDIAYTDEQTARLVQGWKESRDWDQTVLVLAGDHGEGLGQHNHMEHGLTWDEQLHTALLIHAPTTEPTRVDFPVGANDVLPTVLGLIDAPEEAAWLEQATGHDVLSDDFEPTPVFSRMSLRQVHKDKAPTFALTGPKWKFVGQAGGKTTLYDLEADPHERNECSEDHPELVKDFSTQVRESLKAQKALSDALGSGKKEKLDDEAIGELKALGYIE